MKIITASQPQNADGFWYGRSSTDKQEASAERQKQSIQDYLGELGFKTLKLMEFIDEGESGTKADRVQFNALKAVIEKHGKGKLLVVDELSRLSRGSDMIAFVKDIRFHGARLVAVKERFDSDDPKANDLLLHLYQMQNAATIGDLGHRVSSGRRRCHSQGLSSGSFPYGYKSVYVRENYLEDLKNGVKSPKKVVINEQERPYVVMIFEWFGMEDMPINGIAKRLNELKVPTGNRAKSGRWNPQRIRRMLANRCYIGVWTYGETTTKRDSRGKVKQEPVTDTEKILVTERPDLRIIEDDLFNRVQKRLLKNKQIVHESRGNGKCANPVDFQKTPRRLLSHILRCSCCGSKMIILRHHPGQAGFDEEVHGDAGFCAACGCGIV